MRETLQKNLIFEWPVTLIEIPFWLVLCYQENADLSAELCARKDSFDKLSQERTHNFY